MKTVPFTRADYMLLPEGFPAQLVNGMLVKEPAPTRQHHEIVKRVFRALDRIGPADRVFFAPLDVFLDDLNIFQPDVLVYSAAPVSDPSAPTEEIPALVVEVLSPRTATRDRVTKSRTYLEKGVEEVWIVDPAARTIEIRRAGGAETVRGQGRAVSRTLSGFSLVPDDLFGR